MSYVNSVSLHSLYRSFGTFLLPSARIPRDKAIEDRARVDPPPFIPKKRIDHWELGCRRSLTRNEGRILSR